MKRIILVVFLITICLSACTDNNTIANKIVYLEPVVDARPNTDNLGTIRLTQEGNDKKVVITNGKSLSDEIGLLAKKALQKAGFTVLESPDPDVLSLRVTVKKYEFYSGYNDYYKEWYISLNYNIAITRADSGLFVGSFEQSSNGMTIPIKADMGQILTKIVHEELNSFVSSYYYNLIDPNEYIDFKKNILKKGKQRKTIDFSPDLNVSFE